MDQILVFDLDDTLYLERDFVFSGFEAVGDFLQSNGVEGFAELARNLFLQGYRGDIFNRAIDKLDIGSQSIDNENISISNLVDVYRNHKPDISLLPDAHDAVHHYKEIMRLALLSDGYLRVQNNKIDALNIRDDFQGIFLTDFWGRGCWKPAHCAYKKIELFFSVKGTDCIYVSDNPAKDFIAPNQRGWDTIRVIRDDGVYRDIETADGGDPKSIIHSLYELPDVIGTDGKRSKNR